MYKDLGDKIEFLGINLGDREDIEKFIKEYKLSFPVAYDREGKVASSFNAKVPTFILIDINGRVSYTEPHAPERKHLEKLLK